MQTVIEADPSGEYFITIPDEILQSLEWKEGDALTIEVIDNTIVLSKSNS